jgi:hypothetical protein
VSYDLTLFAIPEGVDPARAYQDLMEHEERVLGKPAEQLPDRARAIADRLQTECPGLQRFEPLPPVGWIELNEEDLPAQIHIDGQMVSITMPYFGERASELMRFAGRCCDVVTAEAGYVAFDPQLGRVVTAADLGAMAGHYNRVNAAFPEVIAARKKPWWKFW